MRRSRESVEGSTRSSLVKNPMGFSQAGHLSTEMATVLRAGYLRGGDLWHVAVALHLARNPADICFLTLDQRQREVAASLGFEV